MDVDRDRLIDTIGSALRYGGPALTEVPDQLEEVIREGIWKDFTTRRGKPVHHDSFEDFVTTKPLEGLGATPDLLLRIVAGTKAEKPVKGLLYEEIEPAARPGRPQKDSTTIISTERGSTATTTLARLKRDDPELAKQVVNGEMSAYQAARSKGWKPPRIQVTTPERTAAHLRKHMTAEQCAELARLLTEDN